MRPRVTASAEQRSFTVRNHDGTGWATPEVDVSVTFDLFDHERALKVLMETVDEVRRQITEATPRMPHEEDYR